MNCYECKFRESVPGSAHSSCTLVEDPKARIALLAAITSGHKVSLTDTKTGVSTPLIEVNLQGVKNGWANWPMDYDPSWVSKCLGFKPKT